MSNVDKENWKLHLNYVMRLKPEFRDEEADICLVELAQDAMTEKLKIARDKGRGGWWSTECDTSDLLVMLKSHVDKGDMRDVMNIAAMIYFRQESGITSKSKG